MCERVSGRVGDELMLPSHDCRRVSITSATSAGLIEARGGGGEEAGTVFKNPTTSRERSADPPQRCWAPRPGGQDGPCGPNGWIVVAASYRARLR